MRAFTIGGGNMGGFGATPSFGNYRFGAGPSPLISQAVLQAQVAAAMAAAQSQVAAAKSDYFAPKAGLMSQFDYVPSEMPVSSGKSWMLPLILGGAAVLGVGGYFLLRKKGKR